MRELRLLRQDPEHGKLIFKLAGSEEQVSLHIDEMVRAAVRFEVPHTLDKADRPAAPPPAPEPSVAISPREIQTRVRAGELPDALAAEFGVDVSKVLRFASPVIEERSRIADEARRARARRNGNADSPAVVFGETVDERYAAHGINAAAVSWDSYRREDGEWVVQARWTGGHGEHLAEWIFHRTTRMVTPVDETAADLLSDRPIRVVPPAETRPALSVAPRLAPGVVAFPPMPNADTGPLPTVDEVFDQESTLDQPRKVPPLAPARVPVAAAAPQADALFDTPLPLGIAEPLVEPVASVASVANLPRRGESDDEKAARARIPSWDDILLGVRRRD